MKHGKNAPHPAAPSPEAFNQLVALYNARRYADMEIRAHSLIGQYPSSGFAWKLLGASLQMQGKNSLSAFQKAVELMPNDPESHFNLGVVQRKLGQLKEAAVSYRRALKLNPGYAEAHGNLGNVLKDMGMLDDALASFRQALKFKPDSADTHNNLGTAQKDLGRLDDALTSYRRAIALKPNFPDAYYNMGNVLKGMEKPEEAAACYRRAIELQPDFADALINLGSVLKELGLYEDAAACCRRALVFKPDSADAHNNLGTAQKILGQYEDAAASYRMAIELRPDFADAHNNLGTAQKILGQYEDAAANHLRAIELRPDFADAYNNMGALLTDTGQLDGALTNYRRALELKPDLVEAYSNLLFTLNYSARYSSAYCLDMAQQFGRMVSDKVGARFNEWRCTTAPERLKVGLLSGDLRNHPVGYFLESFLSRLDPTRLELIAYPTAPESDALTSRIKPYFSAWKPLLGLGDAAAANLIHADGVHVLIDLSGHSRCGRLPVFAWKPAPVQIAWLGYFATTGVSEIDYLIADHTGVPDAHRQHFTETVWYLPDTRLCFTPPEINLPVSPLPALKNGHITFGCFQNMTKAGDEVLSAWAAILGVLPGAKLRWQCHQLNNPAVVKELTQRLRWHGIDPARLSLHGSVARNAYLEAHAEVDMMLDTFPYPGGTTTCEALWMGVPTLTLAGDTLLSRQGASLLNAAGLNGWIAASKQDYVEKALMLAADLPKLAALRTGLRDQVSVSPLFDAQRFANHFEDALWNMWRAHIEKSSAV